MTALLAAPVSAYRAALAVLSAISNLLLHPARTPHLKGENGGEDAFGREPLPAKSAGEPRKPHQPLLE